MHQVRHIVRLDGIEHQPRRIDVVAHEILIVVAADLGLQHHNNISADEMALPVARLGEVGILDGDVRLNLLQHGQIGAVLVKNDNVGVALGFQAGDEVLTDEAGATGKNLILSCSLPSNF